MFSWQNTVFLFVRSDDPVVVAIFNGKAIRIFLEDEDDFAMLAENVFTELDTEDRGKLSRNEIKNALSQMGVAMGIPPFSGLPLLWKEWKNKEIDEIFHLTLKYDS